MKKFFTYKFRVYYDSTDAGRIVYHSKYLDFCDKARAEFLRSRGIIQSKLLSESGVGFVVKSAELQYIKPAILDDLLKIDFEIIKNSGIILKIKQNIYLISRNGKNINDELLFSLNIDIVCLNTNGKITRIPKEIMKLLNSDN